MFFNSYYSKQHKVFISHAWRYNNDYERIVSFLNQSGIKYINYSVPKSDAYPPGTDLKAALREQVRQASVVIIIGGMYAHYSGWINYEIKVAKSYGKKIIGVRPWGSERMPVVVQEASDVIVGWQMQSIANAIKELDK